MVEVNWTVITYLLIGLFTLAGFYKGWWKEAITTIFLAILVVLLQFPEVARAVIEFINLIIFSIWELFSEANQAIFGNLLETGLGIESGGNAPQIDPGDSQTWLIILIIFLALAVLLGRSSLPNTGRVAMPYYGYYVTWGGGILGAILGGINGWLIISLVWAYLDGRSLPGGEGAAAAAPREVVIQAVEVPNTTITDSFLPWFFIVLGLLLLIIALRSRVVLLSDEKGFRKIEYYPPLGYERVDIVAKDG